MRSENEYYLVTIPQTAPEIEAQIKKLENCISRSDEIIKKRLIFNHRQSDKDAFFRQLQSDKDDLEWYKARLIEANKGRIEGYL